MRHIYSTETPEVLSLEQVEALLPKWVQIVRDAPVLLLYLHGSYAKGTQAPLSDIDLAVLLEPEHGRDYRLYGELQIAFQDACGRDDIDLVVFNTVGPIIRDRVIRHGRLLYARTEAQRIAFEADALKRAMDFSYYSQVYDDALFWQLKEGHFHD